MTQGYQPAIDKTLCCYTEGFFLQIQNFKNLRMGYQNSANNVQVAAKT